MSPSGSVAVFNGLLKDDLLKTTIEFPAPMCRMAAVNRLRKVVALLLLALWMPATMHCSLETLNGFDFLACCQPPDSAPHQDTDCDQNACATIESGGYMIKNNPSLMGPPPAWLAGLTLNPLSMVLPPSQPPAGLANPAPPELLQCWQFYTHTALPPRAPSFVS